MSAEQLADAMGTAQHLEYVPGDPSRVLLRDVHGNLHSLGLVLAEHTATLTRRGALVHWPDVSRPVGLDDAVEELRMASLDQPGARVVVVVP